MCERSQTGTYGGSCLGPIWRIDDAVGATCVHGFGGAWGMIAVGLFAEIDEITEVGYAQYEPLPS